MAEAVLRHKAAGLDIEVDSAGTGGWHVGESADHRTIRTLQRRGIAPPSRARQVMSQDFELFDYVVGMDPSHVADLKLWRGSIPAKVSLFLDWVPDLAGHGVPDPYYGDAAEFEEVFELIDLGTDTMLTQFAVD